MCVAWTSVFLAEDQASMCSTDKCVFSEEPSVYVLHGQARFYRRTMRVCSAWTSALLAKDQPCMCRMDKRVFCSRGKRAYFGSRDKRACFVSQGQSRVVSQQMDKRACFSIMDKRLVCSRDQRAHFLFLNVIILSSLKPGWGPRGSLEAGDSKSLIF